MQWQTLDSTPPLLPLYWRAALKRKITGSSLPERGLRCRMNVNPSAVAAYRKVCGFADSPMLPATYPHILAFGLQLQLLTDKTFPFPLLGLIHLRNRIRIHRPLGGVGDVSVGVYARNLSTHPKGATFDIVTVVEDALGLLWEGESQMLCRGVKVEGEAADSGSQTPGTLTELTRWKAPLILADATPECLATTTPSTSVPRPRSCSVFPRLSPTGYGTRRALSRRWQNTYRPPILKSTSRS